MSDKTIKGIARQFHDAYERLAPDFGYVTKLDTRKFDPYSKNGKLMIAVCGEVLAAQAAEITRLKAEVAEMKGRVMRDLLDEMSKRHPKIVCTPDCMGGQPRLDGTRMRVTDFLANICVNDWSLSEMIQNWGSGADYTLEDVQAVFRYAWDMVAVVFDKADGRPYCEHPNCGYECSKTTKRPPEIPLTTEPPTPGGER